MMNIYHHGDRQGRAHCNSSLGKCSVATITAMQATGTQLLCARVTWTLNMRCRGQSKPKYRTCHSHKQVLIQLQFVRGNYGQFNMAVASLFILHRMEWRSSVAELWPS